MILGRFLVLALLLPAIAIAGTQRYPILFQGREAGAQETTTGADGEIAVKYRYRDNGRGPDYSERLVLGADGTLKEFELSGTSTFGAPVTEHFIRDGGVASWRSNADQGSADGNSAAFYLPLDASSEPVARLVAAALRRPEHRLALLPTGEARVEEIRTESLDGVNAVLYAVHGLGIAPYFVWLDAQHGLIADISPGYSQLIREDLRGHGNRLEAIQEAVERGVMQQRAALAHALPQPVVLRNVRVFDSEHARLGPPSDVYINEGRFSAVYPTGSKALQAGTEIDGGGRVLLPGLFDMHEHVEPWQAPLHLAAGVTTVRDMGSENAPLAELRQEFASGRLLGPRIIAAGFIEGESPYSSRSGFVIQNLGEAKDAVDWYTQHGFPQIKIYNSFPKSILAETVAYAHQRGLRVSGHVPAFLLAEDVIRMGFDEIQHINQLLLNFLISHDEDTRTLLRFDRVVEKLHEVDFDSPRVQDFIALMKSHHVVSDPTLATFENFPQLQGSLHPAFAAIAGHLPAQLQRELHSNSMDVNPGNIERNRKAYAMMVDFIGRLHRAGIDIVAGTDDLAGFTLHRELELYVKAGIAPAEALRIATWNGAKYSRVLDQLGSITPGKLADAVLLDGDPTTDISAVRRAVLVLKEGVAYRPDELYRALSIEPFVPSLELPALESKSL